MAGQQREVTMRFLAQPGDVNFGGKVHGGMVMKWIDQAGYACAVGWSGRYCVTVAVGGIEFHTPVMIGDLVEVTAKLIATGTSSMRFAVDVRARDLKGGATRVTTNCLIMFVALDEHGHPTPVPPWLPQTDDDRHLAEYASRLVGVSRAMEGKDPPPAG